jgi:alpha-L-arabinofuranosidase
MLVAVCLISSYTFGQTCTLTVNGNQIGKAISPDLFGIFFEDLSYAADGGLYAELVQNRSFEYTTIDNENFTPLTSWSLVTRGGGLANILVDSASPLNTNNRHYLTLTITSSGAGVGVMNAGWDGIALTAGATYSFSFFAKRSTNVTTPITVQLENTSGTVYGTATVSAITSDWTKYSGTITSNTTNANSRLVILTTGTGTINLDMISLFPPNTFKNRTNGLRDDIARKIADLQPKFMRFPGGCLVHGQGVANIYKWKNTIGSLEQRKEDRNIWRYHQSMGLGYYEYFQFCDDIGAKPLPVIAAGTCCPNSVGGQQGIPMDSMKYYVQDILDLIEWANGDSTSTWGAKRAAAGHPKPFNLEYLGIGNEDTTTVLFKQRFQMLYDSLRHYHPEIKICGTAGPFASGINFTDGWNYGTQQGLQLIDEHYYMGPAWFLNNTARYDNYSRTGPKVYIGEYASQGNTHYNAIAEAAYMTSLERNGDVVHMASYAPMICNANHVSWTPNLMFFNNTAIYGTPSYYVQKLFSTNQGDTFIPNTIYTLQDSITGKIGIGTYNTQAQFDDATVTSGTTSLFSDNFSTVSGSWTTNAGTWAVSGGTFNQSGANTPATTVASTINRYSYTYTVRAMKTGGTEGFIVVFGWKDVNNYYWWNIGGWDNTVHQLEKCVSGTRSSVGTSAKGSITLNQWYTISIVLTGANIKCYLDNVLIHDYTAEQTIFMSSVKNTKTGDIVLKVVNTSAASLNTVCKLNGLNLTSATATATVLKGASGDQNSFTNPTVVQPSSSTMSVGPSFTYVAPALSLTVFNIHTPTRLKQNSLPGSDKSAPFITTIHNGNLVIRFKPAIAKDDHAQIFMTDLGGRVEFSRTISDNNFIIPISQFASGVHIVNIRSSGRTWHDKICLGRQIR